MNCCSPRCVLSIRAQDVYRWRQSGEREQEKQRGREKKRDDERDVKHKDDVRGTKRI